MSLAISINGTDYSNLLQYTDRSETLRRVQGPNAGVARDGSDIYDDLAIKYDLQVNTKPFLSSQLASLVTLLSATTVTVVYFSALRNSTVTQTMRVENLSAVIGAVRQSDNQALISAIPIQFRQK